MSYCLAIKVNEGLVFASDSRTNAGLDNVNTYSKMFTYNVGDRAFVILTAGNLATSQAVYHQLEKDLNAPNPEINLNLCEDLEAVAAYIGQLSIASSNQSLEVQSQSSLMGSNFILGGQIRNQDPNILMIYPEGNYIYASSERPFLQIGETKYGKPILDRMINKNTPIGDSARVALLSLDSTMRSDLTVGPPIDFVVYKKDQMHLNYQGRYKLKSPYFKELSDTWAQKLSEAVHSLPQFDWEEDI
ncbi:MAG: 20S proteasome subunit A/B [Gammaproteobacteria bacterium]|nr:MAG: 20S proteasome subunit A/B [Gammaproteobacteria bacterium]